MRTKFEIGKLYRIREPVCNELGLPTKLVAGKYELCHTGHDIIVSGIVLMVAESGREDWFIGLCDDCLVFLEKEAFLRT